MERLFKCDVCGENFISQSKLNHHMGREHGKTGYASKKSFICSVCDHVFERKHVIAHMRTHTGERPFNCTVTDCGMAFKQITALKDHMKRHTGERPFKCTVGDCEMTFTKKSALDRHVKSKHSDERPFKCNLPGCKYRVKISSDLRRHMKKHSDDRPLACPKEGCKFRTKQKCHLRTHLTAVHGTVKAFACSECDYKATLKYYLMRHMRRRHSTNGENTKCSHSECAEYLICSYDLECLLNNQDEANSSQCDQFGREQELADANAPCKPNMDVNSYQSILCPTRNSSSHSTSTAEDLNNSEAENRENIEPNNIQARPSLSKDAGFSCGPEERLQTDGNEQEFFHQGFNWLDILQSSSL